MDKATAKRKWIEILFSYYIFLEDIFSFFKLALSYENYNS